MHAGSKFPIVRIDFKALAMPLNRDKGILYLYVHVMNYKILAKAIATRLQKVLPYLISNDQTGCLKGRSIYANIRSTIDVINYVNEYNTPGIIAYIDFEKAFDTVNWQFMY